MVSKYVRFEQDRRALYQATHSRTKIAIYLPRPLKTLALVIRKPSLYCDPPLPPRYLSTGLPTIGDWAHAEFFDDDTHTIIHGVIPRRTLVHRE
ncbi:MAG: hypothetical protein ACI93R_002095 [Flavobacteriales bacterium]|jgi:hypothetical protein